MKDHDEMYNIETINTICEEIYEYLDNSVYPLGEYLYYEDIENFVKWIFENCHV